MATLSFWGGIGTVTGSKYLVESGGHRVLLDCGLFQGLKELRERNWQPLPFPVKNLDAIVLTHAHIDHTGYLPRVVADGYQGHVYCSRGTAELAKILLPDSARLQEEEAEYRNRHALTRHTPARALYTENDAYNALNHIISVHHEERSFQVAPGIKASFYPAGHLLGSRCVLLDIEGAGEDGKGRRILFSGDLGHTNPLILRDPAPPVACDYLLVESTYGDRLHDPTPPDEALATVINRAARRNSVILIPSFAVGRTQELLYTLRQLEDAKRIPTLPVYVDSPMAIKATELYLQLTNEFDESLLNRAKRLSLRTHDTHFTASRADSRQLNNARGARIIISAAGMMTGGRVLHHAQRVLPDPAATLLFVGYQAVGTTGRRILEGEPEVKIMKQMFPVRCHIERVEGFSSHPDYNEILAWLEELPAPPRTLYLTHGEPSATQSLNQKIQQKFGWSTHIPSYGETIELK